MKPRKPKMIKYLTGMTVAKECDPQLPSSNSF